MLGVLPAVLREPYRALGFELWRMKAMVKRRTQKSETIRLLSKKKVFLEVVKEKLHVHDNNLVREAGVQYYASVRALPCLHTHDRAWRNEMSFEKAGKVPAAAEFAASIPTTELDARNRRVHSIAVSSGLSYYSSQIRML